MSPEAAMASALGTIAVAALAPEAIIPSTAAYQELNRLETLTAGVNLGLNFTGYFQLNALLPPSASEVEAVLNKSFDEWVLRMARKTPPSRILPTARAILLRRVRPVAYARVEGAANPAALAYLGAVERRVAQLEDTVAKALSDSGEPLAAQLRSASSSGRTLKNPLDYLIKPTPPRSEAASTQEINQETKAIFYSNSRWKNNIEWLLNQQLYCEKAIDDRTACNRFVGRAMVKVWGLEDFGNDAKDYINANEIAEMLRTDKRWVEIGTADNQSNLDKAGAWAEKGSPVLAVRPDDPNGHVALIMPGRFTASAKWNLKVPSSAQFSLDTPERSAIGIPLSLAFGPEKKGEIRLYYRK
jgi:hypothetical protein